MADYVLAERKVPWIRFILRGVRDQATDAEDRTVRLVELQAALRNKLLAEKAGLSVIRVAELLFSTPYVSATRLAATLDISFPTAQSAINALVERGDLVESTGGRRNRFYFATAIFDAVYATSKQLEQPTLFDA